MKPTAAETLSGLLPHRSKLFDGRDKDLVLRVLQSPSADDLRRLESFARERSVEFWLQQLKRSAALRPAGSGGVSPPVPSSGTPGQLAGRDACATGSL
jgi:hypothetical protein